MLLFSVGNDAMNTPRFWQLRNERSALLETAQQGQYNYMPHFPIPYGAMSFIPALVQYFVSELPAAVRGGAQSLKGCHRKGLSNEPNFGRIHLAGQYL
jgi:hypothetical protein